MEMHQVRYFLAMAKTLSFTRAAELCHVSQPALTTAIKKLETRLGSSLFHREGRSLLMTEFGRQMLPHLEQIVARTEAAETAAKNFRLLNQVPVRIGVMSTIGPMRVAVCWRHSSKRVRESTSRSKTERQRRSLLSWMRMSSMSLS